MSEFGLKDTVQSASDWMTDWYIQPCLVTSKCCMAFQGRRSKPSQRFQLSSPANTECIDSPGCSIKIPRSSTGYFSHLGWAWTAALLQEQWTKQMGFFRQLPPLPPVCLPVKDAEAFETKYHHPTYLWKQVSKQKGTRCRIKAILLFCAAVVSGYS